MPVYRHNGDVYDIPQDKAREFESQFPEATVEVYSGNDVYDIPVGVQDEFFSRYSDASYSAPSAPSAEEIAEEMQSNDESRFGILGKMGQYMGSPSAYVPMPQADEREPLTQAEIDERAAMRKMLQDSGTIDRMEEMEKEARKNKFKAFGEALAYTPQVSSFGVSSNIYKDTEEQLADAQRAMEASAEHRQNKVMEQTLDVALDKARAGEWGGIGENNVGNGVVDFGLGLWDSATRMSTWDFGVSDTLNGLTIAQVVKKWEEDPESLTATERNLLDAMGMATAVQEAYQDQVGIGYAVGESLPVSAGFMASMYLNPASGLGKSLARNAVRTYGRNSIRKNVYRLAGDFAETAIMTATTGGGRVVADALDRINGQSTYEIDPETGLVMYGGQEDQKTVGEAVVKAIGSNFIENYSEALGEYFDPLLGMSRRLAAGGLRKMNLNKWAYALSDVQPSQMAASVRSLREKAKFGGVFGEIMEEEAGMALNAITVGDYTFSKEEADASKGEKQWIFDLENQLTTALSCAIMSGAITGVETIGNVRYRREMEKSVADAEKAARAAVGDEMIAQIDQASPEGMVDILRDAYMDQNLTLQQKRVLAEYATQRVRMQYYNAADAKARRQVNVAQRNTIDAYEAGRHAQLPQYYNIDQEYRRSEAAINERENAEEIWDAIRLMNNMDENERQNIMRDFSEEDQELIRNRRYNAYRWQGAINHRAEQVEDLVDEYAGQINPYTRPDGTVTTAVLGDNVVYVMSEAENGDAVVYTNDGRKIFCKMRDLEHVQQHNAEELIERFRQQTTEVVNQETEKNLSYPSEVLEPADGVTVETLDGKQWQVAATDGENVEIVGLVFDKKSGQWIPNSGDYRKMTREQFMDWQKAELDRKKANTYEQGDKLVFYVNGEPISAEITGIDPDGNYYVHVSNLVEGLDKAVSDVYTAEELRKLTTPSSKVSEKTTENENTPTEEIKQSVSDEVANGQIVAPEENISQTSVNPADATENVNISAENGAENVNIPETALSRIPKDKKGEPMYEAVDADTAWDAIVEQAGGDIARAQGLADKMLARKKEALAAEQKKKPKDGNTISEMIANENAHAAKVAQAEADVKAWEQIASVNARRVLAEELARAEAEKAANEAKKAEEARILAEQEEQARKEREELQGVPDMVDDTPQDARARGYRRANGHKVERQGVLTPVQGKEIGVKFSNDVIANGRVAVIEAEQLQPSHLQGVRNPAHFIDEAQPKERNDEASVASARKIASNIRPEEITSSVTAYTGAPTVNMRGEAIQGNSRSDALRVMWAEHPNQAEMYKQYLIDHAEEFGLNAEEVAAMEHPVLVNMLDVSDADAINLGQYVAQDTESGGTERIKPKNVATKMGKDIRSFANILLNSSEEEMSFAELVDKNGVEVLKWMNTKGYITPTQYASAFDSKGNLTAEAKNDLRGILYQSIFQGGNTQLEEQFNALPAKAQKAILATAYRDYDSPNTERMVGEIQSSIRAFYALSHDKDFVNAKNYKDAKDSMLTWSRQYQMDDVTGESFLPSEKFSNFALELAVRYKGNTQTATQNLFNELFDLVQGTKEASLFEEADNRPRTLAEAIKETLNIDYNGQNGSNALVGDDTSSQEGRQGSGGDSTSGELSEMDESSTVDRGRTAGDNNTRTEETGGVAPIVESPDEYILNEAENNDINISTISQLKNLQRLLKAEIALINSAEARGELTEDLIRRRQRATSWLRAVNDSLAKKEKIKKHNKWGVKSGNHPVPLDTAKAMFAEWNEDADIQALFDRVFETFSKLGINITFEDNIGSGTTQGWFSISENRVKLPMHLIYSDKYGGQKKASIMLHEMIHGVTQYVLAAAEMTEEVRSKRGIILSEGMMEAAKQLNDIYSIIKKDKRFKGQYGLTDVHEMVSELAEPEFRALLKETSIWQQIVDALKKLLGIDIENNALEGVSRALDYILDNYDENLYNKFSRGKKSKVTANVFEMAEQVKAERDGELYLEPKAKTVTGKATIEAEEGLLFRGDDAMDAEYLSAVNSGDIEKAQQMVDEAAKKAMRGTKVVDKDKQPMLMSHHTDAEGFYVFDRGKIGTGQGQAFLGAGFNFSRGSGSSVYGSRNIQAYLDARKPLRSDRNTLSIYQIEQIIKELNAISGDNIEYNFADNISRAARAIYEYGGDLDIYASLCTAYSGETRDVLEVFEKLGYDSTIEYGDDKRIMNAVVFNSNQIKSADPVTYDDNGNVIPLSERFNLKEEDIRFRDGAPFFSNAERAVENIKQQKATPEQWLAMIKKDGGLKAGEDKWMGLSDWLTEKKEAGVKSLTKDEVLQFIRENQIEIEEVEYGNNPVGFNELKEEYEAMLRDEGYDAAHDAMVDRYGDDFDIAFEDLGGELAIVNEEAAAALLGSENIINSTRLDYTTEGLENKKEIAFVVPTIESWNQSDDIHFGDAGEGRAVAWVRFGETTDEDGNSVLVIDEVQSKRHDEGRSKGYKPRKEDVIKATEAFQAFNREMREKYGDVPPWEAWSEEEQAELTRLTREHHSAARSYDRGIPDAPFDKNYHELVMKRMLRYAAENGFDKVAWTKGVQQAKRYNLAKHITKIGRYDIDSLGRRFTLGGNTTVPYKIIVNDEGYVMSSTIEGVDGKKLSEVVGKDMAVKMMQMPDKTYLEGEDLYVGGEDRNALYDEMIPRFMNKYVKKWGTKVDEVTLPEVEEAGRTMWSVDVTPEMKESVMQGQPMFREGMGTVSDREVSYENDPIAKFQGKPRYYGKRASAFAERERARMQKGVEEAAKILGLDVEIITDASTLQGRKAKAKGWYDIINKKVVVVVPNHVSMGDAVRTVLHEGVAHHGLRELFGDGFDAMLDNIYNNVAPELKARIDAIAERTGVSTSVATEEYLAGLAEETNFEEAKSRGWWSKIKQFFVDMLRKLSMPGLNLKEELTDNELRYLLWRSYQNLVDPNSYLKPLGYLDDVAKQKELKVGEYAENTMATPRVAEMSEAEEWSAITMQRIEELEAQMAQLDSEIAQMEADRDADDASRYDMWEEQLDVLRKQSEEIYDELEGLYSLEAEAEEMSMASEDEIRYRLVDDQAEIDRLESEPTIKAYRAMQVINGELYPPMSAVVDGKLREPIALGRWEQSEERPDLADDNGRFKLDKGNKKSLKAAYNPYFHSSSTPLNDQFSEAQDRDNLVTVEVEVPVSEADGTSGYKAEKAKDAVGTHQWKAGIIQGQLTGTREVFLTRWDKPVRIVPESEVADVIVEMFDGNDIVMPSNVVTPQLRKELEARGITFVDTDNQGKLVEGERKGEHYSKVYGKKAESRLRYRGESLYTPQELAQMETPIYKSKGGFKNLAEAEAWAKENLQGQTRTNQFTGDEISVNRKSVNEMLAPKFSKRVSEDVHMKALQSVLDFIETGIPAEVHKDTHGRDFDVMRLYNAIDIDGKVYRVKSTVRKVKEGDKYYTYEVQKMELIEDTQEALGLLNTNDGGQLNSTNSISGAKLLKGVKKTNSNEEILPSDENIRNDAEIIAEVERESAALGVPVRIVRSVDELPDEDTRKRAVDGQLKGYFDPRTGEVVVYESNTNDANDAKRTILHETVGHKGLRQLIGEERYDKAMVQLMYMLPSEVRDAVLRRAERHGWNAAIAMDEDLADQAERDVQPTWWGKVNAKIRALLRNMGFNVMLTDADVTYLLWRSRKKLMGDTAFDMATNAILKQAARKSAEADAWNEQAFKDAEMRDFEKGAMQRLRNRIGDAQNEYDSAMKTMAFKQRESWQDSMRSLKVFMDVVSKESGKKIADFENAYMYENAMSSTNLMEMQMFRHDVYGRLLKAIHELMESGAKYEEVVDYMMAKHGLERNEKMARAEAEEKVQRWKEKAVEEMQAKAAEELEKQNQRNAIIEAGAKSAYKVKKQRLKGQLERGTISEAQYDHYMQMAEEAYQNELATMKTTHPVDVIAEVEKINTKAEQKLNEYWADHRDYSGLTALTGKDGVAEAESDAMQMVSDFEAKHNTDLLWDETRACTQTILNISHDAGILSDKVYDELWDQYEYYIPLRGFDETTAEEVYTYVGDSKSPYNAPIKTAKGRKSKADDPIATIATMAESAIVEANRNRLKQRFLYMVERHRTELASVSSVWVEKDPITGDCVARFANIPNDATPEEAAQAQKAFEERMEQLHEQEPERYYKASEKPSIPYRVEKKANEHEHQVIVKRNGKDVVITINGDPRVAQAINGLTNPEAAKGFDKFSGNVNRFLSANFTTRNPAFVVSNFVRDGFYTNSMVWAKESPAYAWKYNQNWAKATKLLPSLVSKYKRYEKGDKSALDMSDPVDRAFYEFMINGGETGYTVINSVEDYKGIVAGDLKTMQGGVVGNTKKAVKAVGEVLDTFGRWAEDTSRFAAFLTSREMGRSVTKSIWDAKEISVNFNKKGSGRKMTQHDKGLNSILGWMSQQGRNLYVFWNAGMQGLYNFGKAVKEHPGKMAGLTGVYFGLGMAIAAIFGGHDDDEDYWNLPEYVRRNNICFRVGNKFVTLPLPIELRAIYGMGELAMSWMAGKEDPKKVGMKVVQQISQVMPIDMMADGGGLKAFVPSWVKPIYEVGVNTDWTGMPIYRERTPWNEYDPQWMLAFKSTSPELVAASRAINEATNKNLPSGKENKYDRGWADIEYLNNPAAWEHIAEGYLGGLATMFNQTKKSAMAIWNEDLREVRNIPVVSRFVKDAGEKSEEYALREDYFNAKGVVDELRSQRGHFRKESIDPSLTEEQRKDVMDSRIEMEKMANATISQWNSLENARKKLEDMVNDNPDQEVTFDGKKGKAKDALDEVTRRMVKLTEGYQ